MDEGDAPMAEYTALIEQLCAKRSALVQAMAANPNTVHFAIWMAAVKSMRVVGCGVRGRSG
jgi:hypothetical protein